MYLSNNDIKNSAYKVGFDLCGVVPVEKKTVFMSRLNHWIQKGYHAGMDWMNNNHDLRQDASLYLPKAKSVIVCGISYYTPIVCDGVSRYALGDDYHNVLRRLMTEFHALLEKKSLNPIAYRIIVDSAPFPEKEYAVDAGLGWIGKNSLLINKEFGSYLFLCEMIIDCGVDNYDQPDPFQGCFNCNRCLDNCTTKAIVSPFIIDASRCVSYLTVEHKGEFTPHQHSLLMKQSYFFGCDCCQEVCPYNKKNSRRCTQQQTEKVRQLFSLDHYELLYQPHQIPLLSLSVFKKIFGLSPFYRVGKKRIERNLKAVRK